MLLSSVSLSKGQREGKAQPYAVTGEFYDWLMSKAKYYKQFPLYFKCGHVEN